METTINQRIKILVDDLRINTNKFAISIGKTQPAIKNLIEGGSQPNYETLTEIIEKYNVSADWLLLGKGPMYNDGIEVPKVKDDTSKISFASWKHLEDEVLYLRKMLEMAMGNMANFPNSPQQVGKVLPLFTEGAFAGDYQLAG